MTDPTASRQKSGLRGAGMPVQKQPTDNDVSGVMNDPQVVAVPTGDKEHALRNSGSSQLARNSQDDKPAVGSLSGLSSDAKEREPGIGLRQEKVEIEEIKEPEVPAEVAGWVERKQRGEDVHLAEPVKHRGETLVESTKKSRVKVVLPLTEEGVKKGLHVKVIHSLRWLAVWCGRLVKKLPGKVLYRQPRKI